LESEGDEDQSVRCSFCGTENQSQHAECRNCGRPLSLEQETSKEEKQQVLERLQELDENGVLEKLQKLEGMD
jgi:predicted ATP-dependent serine protease